MLVEDNRAAVARALRRGPAFFGSPEPMTLREWAERYFFLYRLVRHYARSRFDGLACYEIVVHLAHQVGGHFSSCHFWCMRSCPEGMRLIFHDTQRKAVYWERRTS